MSLGRLLIYAGLAIVVLGVLISLGDRLPMRLGRLPGDIVWKGKNSVFYFPLTTSILLSLVLTALVWILGRR
jgi:hypothetical protein